VGRGGRAQTGIIAREGEGRGEKKGGNWRKREEVLERDKKERDDRREKCSGGGGRMKGGWRDRGDGDGGR